jgi:hypothetical protein
LCAGGDRLWIGFGESDRAGPLGGVGYLDLHAGRFVGLMADLQPSLTQAPASGSASSKLDPPTGPPRKAVTDLNQTAPDSLWVAVLGKGVQRYSLQERKWTTPYAGGFPRCVVSNERYVIVGCYEPGGASSDTVRFGGLVIHDIRKNEWHTLGIGDGLPNNDIKSLAIDGDKVWVGGRGFLAKLTIATGRVGKVIRLNESRVQSIQLDQNELWFSAEHQLYRLGQN